MAESSEDGVMPIAVVGLGCRFPGPATSISSLWRMLMAGESTWSEIPKDRMDISTYYHPDNARQGSFFSISADEAKAIDPQQRILLEVSVEALDSAGIDRSPLRGSETGVWIGSFVKDYEQIVLRDPDYAPKYGATGNGTAIMSNRISFFLDINGPSMTIDTGCSASLVCIHNAAQSLRDGEVDLALAGGAGMILAPATMMPMTALNFLSPDGKCYTFDSRANGYGRGEGIGIVVLKRLEDAIRDNDNIRAVIRGSRVNQDGRTPGITLPSAEAQVRNIRAVYKRAGLDFDKTGFVECHGTGTKAGDWREVKAVSDSIGAHRPKDKPVYIGSIKTNIGHLEGCAGIAGLIKGVLAIENGFIPKHINFEVPNPDIDFEASRVKVPTENTPWPLEGLRRASVNCFGFGGTNAHVILDDAAHYLAARGLIAHHSTKILTDTNDALLSSLPTLGLSYDDIRNSDRILQGLPIPSRNNKTHLFVISANDKRALERSLQNLAAYVESNRMPPRNFMSDLAYTLGCRRTKLQWRAAVVSSSPGQLVQKLSQVGQGSLVRTSEEKLPKVAFVFGGQGAQWFAMARELLGFDIFLRSMAEATTYMKDSLGSTFNLLEEMLKDEPLTKIDEPEIAQPATTAVQVALVNLLIDHLGIVPIAVCGHSSGEIAAAYATGAISREDAWELAYYRGQCAATLQIPGEESGRAIRTSGRMLAVGLSEEQAQQYVDAVGCDKVAVACINSPVSVTLSGDGDAIVSIHETLEVAGIFNRLLPISTAYHSHHMKQCESMYLDAISHVTPKHPTHTPTMYSSVRGTVLEWEELRPEYWVENMVSPVLFSEAMDNMMHQDAGSRPDLIIELGPHSSLQSPVRQILDAQEKLKKRPLYFSLLSRNKDASITVLEVLGELWNRGCPIAMDRTTMGNVGPWRPRLLVDLPNYPWNHDKTHWHESHLSKANRFPKHGRYDLIGRPTADSIPAQPRWRGFLRVSENPWIRQHQVQKTTIYPAAGMIAMILEAAKQMATSNFSGIEIKQFRIQKAIIIPSTAHGLEYAVNMTKNTEGGGTPSVRNAVKALETTPLTYHFYIYSKPLDGSWKEHGDGLVTIHREGILGESFEREKIRKAEQHYEACVHAKGFCDEVVIPRQLYETLDVIGMNYGPLFQNITSALKRDGECIATVRVPDTKTTMPSMFEYPHIIHPATLDSVFQTAFTIGSEAMVPSYISSIYVSANSSLSSQGHEFMVHTQAQRRRFRDASATFVVSEDFLDGPPESSLEPLIIVENMTFTALTVDLDGVGGFLPNHRNLCSEIRWEQCDITSLPNSIHEASQDSPVEANPVLILIPEVMSTGLQDLLSAISNELDNTPRTLLSISNDEVLPELCLSLLDVDGRNLLWDWSEQEYSRFRTVVLRTSRMFWVARGSQMEVTNPKGGLFQALARTIHSEYPEKNFVTLDISEDREGPLPSSTKLTIANLSRQILSLFHKTFTAPEDSASLKETEYVERDGQLMIPRLVPIEHLNAIIERGTAQPQLQLQRMPKQADRPLKLKVREIGNLESLCWDDDHSVHLRLSPDEVKVQVLSAALSVLDADVVMGRSDDSTMGTDLFGVIVKVGKNVTSLAVGDHVLGVARGSLRDFITCHQALVYKFPKSKISTFHVFFPTSFTIAQYSFGKRLKAGDSILIHSGASAFGQAAIQLAQFIGARTFVTVENNDERAILRGCYNIPDRHILDAHSDTWVDTILRLTNNKGVQVVYDPTIDDADVHLDGIAEGGHIVRFTRKENVSGRLDTVNQALTFMALDLVYLIDEEPEKLGEAFSYLCDKFLLGQLKITEPTPLKSFSYSQLPEAFKTVIGDVQAGLVYCRRPKKSPVPIIPPPIEPASNYVRDDATYVLSGGLGGLGIEIAKLLVANGARHIAFLARSGARTELARSCIGFLENRGVQVLVLTVDICEKDEVGRAAAEITRTMPAVRGVFQCAAALRDAVFENMTYESWQAAVRPKTVGSWNLREVFVVSGRVDLDFFIFLSSSAGVIGTRGQANYAVGNAFQDALAIHMNTTNRITNTNATSIDLGPVLGAGMLAEDPRTLDMLKASGFFGIRLQDFKLLLERAIVGRTDNIGRRMPAQVVCGVGTGGLILQNKPADPYWTRTALFARLNKVDMPTAAAGGSESESESGPGGPSQAEQSVPQLLREAADPEAAVAVVGTGLRTMLSRSMNVAVDDVDENRSPSAYGVDSLVAVGVRNWVYRECCGVDVSVFEVLSDQSILELAGLVVQKGGFGN